MLTKTPPVAEMPPGRRQARFATPRQSNNTIFWVVGASFLLALFLAQRVPGHSSYKGQYYDDDLDLLQEASAAAQEELPETLREAIGSAVIDTSHQQQEQQKQARSVQLEVQPQEAAHLGSEHASHRQQQQQKRKGASIIEVHEERGLFNRQFGTDTGKRNSARGVEGGKARHPDHKTGIFYPVPGPYGDVMMELLNEPVPEDCYQERHAEYEGKAVTWGTQFKTQSARKCCNACKRMSKHGVDVKCNVWVWCGSQTCWSPEGNHTAGECWLKWQGGWDNNVDKSASNLVVTGRGAYPQLFRQVYRTAPEHVEWTAGVIPIEATA